MRASNTGLLLLVPLIALLLFGVSVAWDRLETIDPTVTGSIGVFETRPPAPVP
ncbi:hypothetical protein M0654_01890 [Rhizobium sp. NTR19]|uniref:Uncharacterized protein n=1 Tax=Neorhizobium turbinariae TaxID=2937795 RepID=A0ABT0ILH1_9HYPH|nr:MULTISPECIES: hypothetical protein [Neorhizobium]MCK8778724.1 hypothetical protein [Neorhizobium turbinariae]